MSSPLPEQVKKALELTMDHLNRNAYGSIADDWADLTDEANQILSFAQIVRLLKALLEDPNMNKDLVTKLVQNFIKENEEGCEDEGEEEEGEDEGCEDEGCEDEGEEEEPASKKQRV